jgi:hypothetical protein
MKNKNKTKQALIVRKVVEENYERGRHDKCKEAVFRNIVSKQYPMSRSTFFRYLSDKPNEKRKEVPGQSRLFD